MKYFKIVFITFLLVVVSTVFFVVINKKQIHEMQHVSYNIASVVDFEIKDAQKAVNYLHLNTKQVMENKDKFQFSKLLRTAHSIGRYTYSLDDPSLTGHSGKNKANLLGWSEVENDIRYTDEQAAALFLSDNLKLIATQNKNFGWVYYFSKHHFAVIYPYISAEDFSFSVELEREPFFACATPEHNPKAELFFTPLYNDLIGKGLMVTIGKPVYVKGEFLGTVDIDITLNNLDNILFNLDTLNNKILLYNDKFQVLGSNNIIRDFNRSKIYKADNYLDKKLLKAEDTQGKIEYLMGKYLFVKKIKGTPFTLIYFQDASKIWLTTLMYLIPIFLFFILFVAIIILYDKSRSVMKRLEEQATKDYLTGAYNRRYFFDVGATIFLKAQRKKNSVAVVMLDIDDFKRINDLYGHKAGDLGIIHIKKILDKNLRRTDLFARFGGEEFCILLDDISLDDVEMLLEKIRKEFEVNVIVSGKERFSYTVSFGVAYGMLSTLEEMINLADKALYKSKSLGKNTITIYHTH